MQTINLALAITKLNDTIYLPTSVNHSDTHLSDHERLQLLSIRDKLTAISRAAQFKLTIDRTLDFNQEKIDNKQMSTLENVFEETLLSLNAIIIHIEKEQNNQQHSIPFKKCLYEVLSDLKKSKTLVEKIKLNEKYLDYFFKKSDLFKLCKQLGALYIPISQSFDPMLGGFEKEGSLELSQGVCSGKVISWIEACAKTNILAYPFYANDNQTTYHEQQIKIKRKYKLVHATKDLMLFSNDVAHYLKENNLYYISLVAKDAAHALGIRMRQDNVYELFDPNDFHLFCHDRASLSTIIGYLLAEYSLDGFDTVGLLEADVCQFSSTQCFFPHLTHVIQATHQSALNNDQQFYYDLLRKLFNTCQKSYKKYPEQRPVLFKLFLTNLKQFCNAVTDAAVLEKIINTIKSLDPLKNFFENENDKIDILTYLTDRERLITRLDFQEILTSSKDAIKELIKIEGEIAKQLNDVKEEIVSHFINNRSSEQDEFKLLLLTNKSIRLWQFFQKIKNDDQFIARSLNAINSASKSNNDQAKLNGIKELINSHKKHDANELEKINKVDYESEESKRNYKVFIFIQRLIKYISSIGREFSLNRNNMIDQNEQILFAAYGNILNRKLADLRSKAVLIWNDFKISPDKNKEYKQLLALLKINSDQFHLLHDHYKLEETIYDLVYAQITEQEVAIEIEQLTQVNLASFNIEIINFVNSLQTLINYIEAVKDEYYAGFKPENGNNRSAITLVTYWKMHNKLESYAERIKLLIEIKNKVLTECYHKKNEALFLELSSKIRQEYKQLFPVDFNLIDNYSLTLDLILLRNKPIILDENDKILIKQLESKLADLELTIFAIDQKIKFNKQNSNIDFKNLVGIITEFKKEVMWFLYSEKNPAALIEFVDKNLKAFFSDSHFNIDLFLARKKGCAPQVIPATRAKFSMDILNEDKMFVLAKKVYDLIMGIVNFSRDLAPEILNLASIELSSDGFCVIDKNYGSLMTDQLNELLKPVSNTKSQDELISLRRSVIALNYIFRGKMGIFTDITWSSVGLAGLDDESQLNRQEYGLAIFNLFRTICAALETKLLSEKEDMDLQRYLLRR